jgi:hypothetical protein
MPDAHVGHNSQLVVESKACRRSVCSSAIALWIRKDVFHYMSIIQALSCGVDHGTDRCLANAQRSDKLYSSIISPHICSTVCTQDSFGERSSLNRHCVDERSGPEDGVGYTCTNPVPELPILYSLVGRRNVRLYQLHSQR